jgi:hypothetical protein
MDRLDLHLKGTFILLMIVLGFMSCGMVPFVVWFVSVRHYPKALDRDGVTLKDGRRLPWKDVTAKKRLILRKAGSNHAVVTGVGLSFGKTTVSIAPRVLVEGPQVLPFLSRVLGEDLTKP